MANKTRRDGRICFNSDLGYKQKQEIFNIVKLLFMRLIAYINWVTILKSPSRWWKNSSYRTGHRHSASRLDSYSTTIWFNQAAWIVRSGHQYFSLLKGLITSEKFQRKFSLLFWNILPLTSTKFNPHYNHSVTLCLLHSFSTILHQYLQ